MSDRLPPHSMTDEECVLGCVLEDPERTLDLLDERGSGPDWFYNPRHRALFAAMHGLRNAGSAVDEVTLFERVKQEKDLGDVLLFLSSLRDKVPSVANVRSYVDVLEDRYRRRRMLTACTEAARAVVELREDVGAAMTALEGELVRLREPMARRTELHIKQLMQEVVEEADKLHRGRGQMRGLPTGLNYLDEKLIQGIREDYYAVLAGRPGDGKTSLAMNIIEHLALHYEWAEPSGEVDGEGNAVWKKNLGVPVGVFSLEMSSKSLGFRLACAHGGVSEAKFRQGFPTSEQIKALGAACVRLSKANIYLDCEPRQTIGMIRAKARRWARQYGVKLFVLDYLQLVRVDGRRFNDKRVDELTEISAEIMSLKKELQVPWLVLAQMNRNIEQAEAKRVPVLSDLKDCGAIEQDCDVAMFLYKPSREMLKGKNNQPGDYEILDEVTQGWDWSEMPARVNAFVAKNRYGPTGSADLLFQKNLCKFHDWHKWKVEQGVEGFKQGERQAAMFPKTGMQIEDEDVPR